MNFAPRGYGRQKATRTTQHTKRMLVQATLKAGDKIARRKIAQREAFVMMGGWRWGGEEERRGEKGEGRGRSRIDPDGLGGGSASLVAEAVCECVCPGVRRCV